MKPKSVYWKGASFKSALATGVAVLLSGGALQAAQSSTAPGTSVLPYLLPAAPAAAKGYDVSITSLLTVKDPLRTTGYQMVGLPDGLGAFDNGNGTFTVLMNHEIRGGDLAGGLGTTNYVTNAVTGIITTNINAGLGVTRAHGGKGAFVSRWVFNKSDFSVVSGEDMIKTLHVWDTTAAGYRAFDPVADFHISRLCAAELPPVTAFLNAASGLGTTNRIFMNGEEDGGQFRPGQGGRAFAHVATGPDAGQSWELPSLGKFAWENAVPHPMAMDQTLVMGLDDSDLTNSQVYAFIGTKQATGLDIQKAGLANGITYGIRVELGGVYVPTEHNTWVFGGATSNKITSARFKMQSYGDAGLLSHQQLDTQSLATSTAFQRVEDGAWDPARPNDFYFVTTGRVSGSGATNNVTNATRLWRLRFDDVANPTAGGTIDMVLEGPAGTGNGSSDAQPVMLDNIGFAWGKILLTEDPGNNDRITRIWMFDPANNDLTELAAYDQKFVNANGASFLTRDEEASGIMDMTEILGPGWALAAAQVHRAEPGERVELGQLFLMHVAQRPLTAESTTVEPYYKPSVAAAAAGGYHVSIFAMETVKDTNRTSGYQMVGLPDGLGALNNGDGTFQLFMNHELMGGNLPGGLGFETYATNAITGLITTNDNSARGIGRAYGGKGAFVSEWTVNRSTLNVTSGRDLVQPGGLKLWNGVGYRDFDPITDFHVSRLCSADLPDLTAFYNPITGLGATNRIFMTGEEDGGAFRPGQDGRAFAHFVTGPQKGTAYELPYLGKMSWENAVASPFPQNKTIVMGLDDSELTNSQVYVYLGLKGTTGTDLEKAGLQHGNLFGIRVDDAGVYVKTETTANVLGASSRKLSANFSLYNFGSVANRTGVDLDNESNAQITNFQRVEDGAWNPTRPNEFFFTTTGRVSGTNVTNPTRLWKLTFDDITHPEWGGIIELALEGPAGTGNFQSAEHPVMIDNLCFTTDGRLLLQEDPGNTDRLAKVWIFDPETGELAELAAADPKFFATGGAGFLTRDEEASGIFDASEVLGPGWFLWAIQAHKFEGGEVAERGQLVAMKLDRVRAFPSLRLQPKPQTVNAGSTIVVNAAATGTGPFTYQWFWNGVLIPGATEASIALYDLDLSQAGDQLTVRVTSPEGSVTSQPALIKVRPVIDGGNPQVALYPAVVLRGTIGGVVTIEYRDALDPVDAWKKLTDVTITNNPTIWFDTNGVSGPRRFFRTLIP